MEARASQYSINVVRVV